MTRSPKTSPHTLRLWLLVSRIVDTIDPTLSLMTFLVLFMAMFWLAWPLAVRVTTYLIPETALERRVRLDVEVLLAAEGAARGHLRDEHVGRGEAQERGDLTAVLPGSLSLREHVQPMADR